MVSVTFHLNSPVDSRHTFATGSVGDLRGDSGLGFFRLTLPVEFVLEPAGGSVSDPGRVNLTDLMAEVRTGGKLVGTFIAPLNSLPTRSYPERSNRAYLYLTCDLDRARLQAIEGVRAGGNITFDVSLVGRFSTGDAFSVGDSLIINQGVWISILDQMGYQKTLLIEVPAPDPSQQPELAEAVRLLGQALGHTQRGHDRDAVGALRDVLDQISLALGDDDNLDAEITRVLFSNSRSMTKAERLRVLRRALKLVTHPARHRDEVSVLVDWSRIDALQMITMVSAFVNEMGAPGARPSVPQPSQVDGGTETEAPQPPGTS
jgi:hypothetical protein